MKKFSEKEMDYDDYDGRRLYQKGRGTLLNYDPIYCTVLYVEGVSFIFQG